MKDTRLPLAASLAVVLLAVSCTIVPSGVVQPGQTGNVVQLGGKLKLQTAHANLEVDNEASFAKAMDLGMDVSRGWFAFKSIDRFFDSEDATTAATEATKGKEIDAATKASEIESAETIRLKELELEAMEVPAP